MLSVQSPGCAGMERLGVPARNSLGSPVRDDRNHLGRILRVDARQAHDILVRDGTILSDRQVRTSNNSHHHYDYIHRPRNDIIRCPHHIPLSDGEWGPDRDLQIRAPYQQTEITRTYIKPPPNKTAFDVPETYNLFPSSSACNLSQRVVTTKSKPNPIAKFFHRISNSKSPDNQSRNNSNGTSINNLNSSIGTTINNSITTASSAATLSTNSISTTSVNSTGANNNYQYHHHQQQQQQQQHYHHHIGEQNPSTDTNSHI